jgi:hypothetical protein
MAAEIGGQSVVTRPVPPRCADRRRGPGRFRGTSALHAAGCPFLVGVGEGIAFSCLLASTSGWSNGSMPMIAPATAVAISQRKNSCADTPDVLQPDPCDRMADALQRLDRRSLRRIRCRRVRVRGRRRTGRRRSVLAAASGSPASGIRPRPRLPVLSARSCSSQAPKIGDAWRGDDGDLVAAQAALPRCPARRPVGRQDFPMAARRVHRTASSLGRLQQAPDVETHRCGRRQAELRQHRIASADRRDAVEDVRESPACLARSPGRSPIGHGDEIARPPCPCPSAAPRARRNSP